MRVLTSILTMLLGLIAVAEHLSLLVWGVIWPLWHLAQYPGDDGVNLFVGEASLLFLAFSLAFAADLRGVSPRPSRPLMLAAMAFALPCGVGVTLALMRVLFLDPVVVYLTLLPGLAALACPYVLAAFFARRMPMKRLATFHALGVRSERS